MKGLENKDSSVLAQEQKLAEDVLETRWLTPENASFFATQGGFVSLKQGDTVYPRVLIYRSFPFDCPEAYLSVREEDKDNREIGLIAKLRDFDSQTVELIRQQLALRYFMPKIEKIFEIKEQYGFSYWFVKTDKGDCRFTVDQNGVSKITDTRLIISDVDGNRFELPDVTRLSAKELRMVDLYM
ncbi:MAG: DUF1854 domain-containing protein [Clostridia bacterium]|nr:DUF1854 domain-containing protein [Clostridia bacterium]